MVRFNCGCIGFPIDAEQFVCLSPCEEPDTSPYLTIRQVTKGSQDVFEPLSDAERQDWLMKLNAVIGDGERYRRLKWTIKEFLA